MTECRYANDREPCWGAVEVVDDGRCRCANGREARQDTVAAIAAIAAVWQALTNAQVELDPDSRRAIYANLWELYSP